MVISGNQWRISGESVTRHQRSFTPLIHTYKESPLVGEDRIMKVASGQSPLPRHTPRSRLEKRDAIHPDTEG